MARLGNLTGVAFDPEGYAGGRNLFTFSTYSGHSFAACQAQLRLRGQQFMTTIQRACPDSTLFLFGGLSMQTALLAAAQGQSDPDGYIADQLEHAAGVNGRYGLLPAFLNGMLDVVEPGMALVDGSEVTYTYSSSSDYLRERSLVLEYGRDHLIDAGNRVKYMKQVSLATALYLDATFDQKDDPGRLSHYMDAATRLRYFGYQVYWGLEASDRYLWVYSETTDWFARTAIPEGSEAVMSATKKKVEAGLPQGDDTIEAAIALAESQVVE